MNKENVANRFKKIKTNIEDSPTPVIQKVAIKKERKSPKKEGVEYVRVNTQIPKDLYVELNTLKFITNTSQIEIIEEALRRYLPDLRNESDNQ